MKFRITTRVFMGKSKYLAQAQKYWWWPFWIDCYRFQGVMAGGGHWVEEIEQSREQIRQLVQALQKRRAMKIADRTVTHQVFKYDPQDGMFP
jgi:hypothetical protein